MFVIIGGRCWRMARGCSTPPRNEFRGGRTTEHLSGGRGHASHPFANSFLGVRGRFVLGDRRLAQI
jgi:hypothetical protein